MTNTNESKETINPNEFTPSARAGYVLGRLTATLNTIKALDYVIELEKENNAEYSISSVRDVFKRIAKTECKSFKKLIEDSENRPIT